MVRSVSSAARASDAASQKSERTEKDTTAPAEQHCLVDSDDEGLLSVEDLEWALAQRSTDPFIKQRLQKGKFMFVKVAGCEGFHCYETELLDRLQALGMDLLGPLKAQAATEARAAAQAAAEAAATAAATARSGSTSGSQMGGNNDSKPAEGNTSQRRASRRHKQAPGRAQHLGDEPHDGSLAQEQQQQQQQQQQQLRQDSQQQPNTQELLQQEQQPDDVLQQASGKQQQQHAAAPTLAAGQQRRQRQRWAAHSSSDEPDMPPAEAAENVSRSNRH